MSCCVCTKSKTSLVCGICNGEICKSCTVFLSEETFSFMKVPPAFSVSKSFCSTCYTNQVEAEVLSYEQNVEKAKNINVFEITQGKETRFIKRKEAVLKVIDCPDRDEAILRLAFFASEKGFNSIIDLDLKPKKIQDARYQHLVWNASAIPANVEDRQLLKDRSIWSNPN